MPYEGYKGGGYDRSTMIRPDYHRRQVPIVSSAEQSMLLPDLHVSLQHGFSHARRYESHMTAANGRTFAASREGVPWFGPTIVEPHCITLLRRYQTP